MKKEYISTGKNVDIAIKNGLLEIGKNREDVDIKILETGGLFKKAKVNLIYDINEISTKQEEKVDVVKNILETPVAEENNIENTSVVENSKVEENQVNTSENSKVEENNENTSQTSVIEEKEEIIEEVKPIENVQDSFEAVKNEPLKERNKEKVEVNMEALKEKVINFLTGLAEKMNIQIQVECQEKDKELNLQIKGENVGKLIGYRGETLNALQYLISCLKEREENRVRIYLDVEGYKEKREETLIELANKMADKAEEIERNVHLDPMSAYERRIIHTALQNRQKVETESTGEGVKRHVVIKFKR